MSFIIGTDWLRLFGDAHNEQRDWNYITKDRDWNHVICTGFILDNYQVEDLPSEIQIHLEDEPCIYTKEVKVIYKNFLFRLCGDTNLDSSSYIYTFVRNKLKELFPNVQPNDVITLYVAIYIHGDLYLQPKN